MRGWEDVEAALLAATDRQGNPLVTIPPSSGTNYALEAVSQELARWIDEHYIPREPMKLHAEDMLLLPESPDLVGRDRARLEALLSENAETIAAFAKDAESAVRIVALIIGTGGAR